MALLLSILCCHVCLFLYLVVRQLAVSNEILSDCMSSALLSCISDSLLDDIEAAVGSSERIFLMRGEASLTSSREDEFRWDGD